MKKIIIFVTLLMFINFFVVQNIKATTNFTLTREKFNDVWWTRGNGSTGPHENFSMGNQTTYCIEAGVKINTNSYLGTNGLINSPYDDETNKLMELIGHYGYDYPGHQTLKFRMATQALIWELTSNETVEYWTYASKTGEYINIDYEKNEIMKLVNNHYNKPSFNGKTIEGIIGKEILITDDNNLLSEYEIFKSQNLSIRIEGNNIYATPLQTGDLTLAFVRKHYDSFTTIVFSGNGINSQKMGYFRFSDPVLASIKITSLGGDITINKLDSESYTNVAQGEGTLSGATYGVYDLLDKLVTTITTDEYGYAQSAILPSLGDFYVKEISASIGYELDDTKYYFSITEDNLHPKINVYEQVIKRPIELNKFYAQDTTGLLNPEINIEFGIYDKYGFLIETIITDNTGFATVDLVYGTYTLKQLTTTDGHEKIEDIEFIVNQDSPDKIKFFLTNAPISAKLKLVKKDTESNKNILLSDITFKIKNLSTNQYICQKITYPTIENICKFKTDENGEFITPYPLVAGSYEIEEITAPTGYLLSTQGIIFTIDENSEIIYDINLGDIIEVAFFNEQIKGEIIINKTGELITVDNNNVSYELINLADVEFSIYAAEDIITADGIIHYKKGDFVNKVITDKNGYASLSNLYLGKYKILETKTLGNYLINENEYFVILNEKDKTTAVVREEINLINELKKGTLEFTKTDFVTGDAIPNTTIQIFNEYDELLFTTITDKDGKVVIEELPLGKYYIKEYEAATGYLITDEILYFEILENGEIVKVDMTNEKIEIVVPNTQMDDLSIIEMLSCILVISGLGVIIYAFIKKK